jgi:type VI secretion system ImpM family protein
MPHGAAGFFGKLPSAGDFVQRRLPSSFVDVWDQHFEGAVAKSRSALGDAWHEAFHDSPVWRFLLGPGICGETAWAGVMGPGADRVGRCFPMVLAAPVTAGAADCVRAIRDGAGWFDAAERVHRSAQADPAVSVDSFAERVAALAGPLDAAQGPAPGLWHGLDWSRSSHWRFPWPAGHAACQVLAELWLQLANVPGHWCLWWAHASGRVPASLLVTDGLPRADAYAGFLDAAHGATAWQSAGTFESVDPVVEVSVPAAVADLSMESTRPSGGWLPDDLDLLAGLGDTPAPLAEDTPPTHVAATAPQPAEANDSSAGMTVLLRPEVGLSLVAAEAGAADPRQQAVSAVAAIAGDMLGAELIGGMQVLRNRIMALNPQLQQVNEDLIDPVQEDCAVIAAHVANGQAELLRIGAAAGWHWRHGRLQPFFARSDALPTSTSGRADDIDDLLFSPLPLAAPGLGATAQPTCGEVSCAVQAGDRLLLMATHQLLQLPPELLARNLAVSSCEEARKRIATAAGLGTDSTHWPLAIIEVQA